MSYLCISEINPLPVLIANIFSHSEGCCLVLFMVSFAVQNVLCLTRSYLHVFVFNYSSWWVKKDFAVIYVQKCSACVFL